MAIFGDVPVAGRAAGGEPPELDELFDDLLLARLDTAGVGRVRIHLRVASEMVEARVPLPSSLRRLGIDLLEVGDDRLHRGVEAVEIEAVEAHLGGSGRQRVVPTA
jgi:hypothetical protein